MRYVSTRATDHTTRAFSDILLEGLAPDGGLYLPVEYPQVGPDTLARWREVLAGEGYAALAFEVCSLFADDIPAGDLRAICDRAYAPEKFLDPAIVPVTRFADDMRLAHLSNGPSAAFKDMAMQLLGELFSYELARRGEHLTILGATSGDTGSAAEYALLGKPGIRVVMLSPADRMTPFQQAQMYSIDDPGIVNLAVEGVFDDCQDLVKAVNADAGFKQRHRVGAVNSINWARLMAQIVYYFAAWLQVSDGEPVSFAVPSGNFGNIAAGHIARQMGLPIANLVLATTRTTSSTNSSAPASTGSGALARHMPPVRRRWTSPRRRTSSGSSPTFWDATGRGSRTCSAGSWPKPAGSICPARIVPGSVSSPVPPPTPTG